MKLFNIKINKTKVSIRYSSQKRPGSVLEPSQPLFHWVLAALSSMPECAAERPPWPSADVKKKRHVQYFSSTVSLHGMHITKFPYFPKAPPPSGCLSIKPIQISVFSRSSNPFLCPQNFPSMVLCQFSFFQYNFLLLHIFNSYLTIIGGAGVVYSTWVLDKGV